MKSASFVLPCTPEYQYRGLLRRARRERISLGSLTKVRVREKAHYEVVAEITLKNRVLKKSLTGHGEEDDT